MGQPQQFDVIGKRGILGFLFEELEQFDGQEWVGDITNVFESNQDTETYAGLGMSPQMREWVGPKQAQSFQEFSVNITNKDFEATLLIKNKDRRRDKTGQLRIRIADLAQRARGHDAVLTSALIDGGQSSSITIPGGSVATVKAFDGQPLWSTTHTLGATAISNLLTVNLSTLSLGTSVGVGSPSNPTPAAISNVIQTMISQLYGFKDDQNQPMNEFARRFMVMVPPAMSGAASQAVTGQFLALGYENPLKTVKSPSLKPLEFTVVPNPRLTLTDTFYLFRQDGTFKPIIRQYEPITAGSDSEMAFGESEGTSVGAGIIVKVLAEGSDFEFDENGIKVSVEKSGMVGLGRFDQAVAAKMTQTAQ